MVSDGLLPPQTAFLRHRGGQTGGLRPVERRSTDEAGGEPKAKLVGTVAFVVFRPFPPRSERQNVELECSGSGRGGVRDYPI